MTIPPSSGESASRSPSRGLVLLVDDLPETRTTYRAYLETGGLRVEEAGNGAEALTAAAAIRPDVILMDLWMPVLDGWNATRHLKDDPRTRHIPVIAVSGRGLRRAEIEARSAGCMMFLEKPCRPEDMLAAIDCALRVPGARHGRRSTLRTK